jgi:hypothetical protein
MDSRPSDETLLLAVAERDMGAFRTLYERHAGWLAIPLARRCPGGCPVFRDPGDDGLEASRTPPCGQPDPPRRPTPFCLGRPVRSVDGTYPH